MSGALPSTPEGRLLRRAREKAVPKISMLAAAKKAGISQEAWGYAERGYTPARGGNPPREFHPPAGTLARMFDALGTVTPEQVSGEGGRPDAAALMDPPAPEPPARTMPMDEPEDDEAWQFFSDRTPAGAARRAIFRATKGRSLDRRLRVVSAFDQALGEDGEDGREDAV